MKVVGAAGLEPAEPLGVAFTAPCDCRYAIHPKMAVDTGFEPVVPEGTFL